MSVMTAAYRYELPQELIAQDPLADRAASRLLIMDRKSGALRHETFRNIIHYLRAGDCLVLNNTKVLPARLMGTRLKADIRPGTTASGPEDSSSKADSGGAGTIEVLLLRRRNDDIWETLIRPGKKARPGTVIRFGGGLLTGQVVEVTKGGNRLIRFTYQGIFEEILDRLGEMPLPPYITHRLTDQSRYQTVYARHDGSAAAPTAGLHFTPELLEAVAAKGVRLAYVTLHVGLGTFRPVKVESITEHHMHSEYYEISRETADLINETRQNGGRVICVGTTSCRAVESAAYIAPPTAAADIGHDYLLKGCCGDTDIFIYPGYRFRIMDGLITNFHLPESTLLMLVSAFAGRDRVLAAYETAIREKYRFFSFGEAMFIS